MSVYPEYRDSGLPWLGPIPAHWEIRRNGRLFTERREAADPELPLLEVSIHTGVRVRQLGDGGRKQAMTDRSKYQRARSGDIAYNMMRMWQGAVGVVPTDGLVSPAYVVARPYEDVEPRYYAYLFRTAAYLQQVAIESRGIVPDRNRLYWDAFKAMPSAYPPPDEQRVIANYIDQRWSLFRQLESAKRRTMRVLAEQARSVVESRLEWTNTTALRRVADVRLSGIDKHSHEGERTVRLCNYVDVYRHDYIDADVPFMSATATDEEIDRFELKAGDVIVTKDSESWTDIGVPAFVSSDLPGVVCGYHLALIRPDPERVDGEYLFRALTAASVAQQFHRRANGVTRFGLSQHAIKSLTLPLPSIEVQRRIAEEIRQALEPLNATRARIERELELIREFHQRQVADAVSGRLDVRRLPLTAGTAISLDAGAGFDNLENLPDDVFEDDEVMSADAD